MKKQFKLIKEYPYSPNRGSVVEFDEEQLVSKTSTNQIISISQVEKHPEYWQEITKDWEILEFKYADGSFFKLKDNGMYSVYDPFEYNLDYMINRVGINFNIHKVKRLSDGEVFEVVDDVRPAFNLFYDFLIDRFDVVDGEMLAYSLSGKGFSIKNIEKVTKRAKKGIWNWACEDVKREDFKPFSLDDFYEFKEMMGKTPVSKTEEKELEGYEILEFKGRTGDIYRVRNGKYGSKHMCMPSEEWFTLHDMLHNGFCFDSGDYTIHRVRRLSDGKVFTVGDHVDGSEIKGFRIWDETIQYKSEWSFGVVWNALDEAGKFTNPPYPYKNFGWLIPDGVNIKRMNTGWQCPKCETIWSPDTDKCKTCLTDK